MKVTETMTNESGNRINADFLDIDGCGIRIKVSWFNPDLAEITLDSTAWPNVTGWFSAKDLLGIAVKCVTVAGQIITTYGTEDPYEDQIRKVYARENAEGK